MASVPRTETASSSTGDQPDAFADIADLSYEQARDELVRVVGELEQGSSTLEQSLALWERGELSPGAARSGSSAPKPDSMPREPRRLVSRPMPDENLPPAGRVVAELGRPETPEETAARKAENSRAHRANQTTRNLVLALLASLAIVLFVVLAVPRSDQAQVKTVDYRAIAAQAQQGIQQHLASPRLPASWKANVAEQRSGDQKSQLWYIGFITPGQQFIGLEQGIDATDSFFGTLLGKARSTGTTVIGGVTWTIYNQRDSGDVGNYDYSLTATIDDTRVLLHGSANDNEFATLAAAVGSDLAAKDSTS